MLLSATGELCSWWNRLRQWFSNFLSQRALFTAPKTASDPSFCQSFYRYSRN